MNISEEIKPVLKKIKANKVKEAELDLLDIIKKNDQNYLALNLIGQIKMQNKNYKEAINFFNKSLDLKKDSLDVMFNKGVALNLLGLFKEAEIILDELSKLNTSHYEIFYNLASVQKKLNNLISAKKNFYKSLEINSKHYPSLFNLANCYKQERDYENAITNYKKVLELKNDHQETFLNLGICYYDNLELEKAIECFNSGLKINPSNFKIQYNKALALLKNGNFREGWECYESRWLIDDPIFQEFKSYKDKFDNSTSSRLLILAEQGIGDEIMFSEILNDFKEYKNLVIVRCDKRLLEIFKRSFPHIKFIGDDEFIDQDLFDHYISIGSLYRYYRNQKSDFNAKGYLVPDKKVSIETKINQIRKNDKQIIGLSWQSKNTEYGKIRSIDLIHIIKNLNYKKYNFINLQYGNVSEELMKIESELGIKIHTISDNFHDIDELASVINSCDHVITIDNSTVHLCGALGKKCTLLLPKSSDWRWLKNEPSSYWYPNLNILTQVKNGNWDQILKNLDETIDF